MTRVDQTILASDPNRQGNCLPACVATILDKPLETVPHFIESGQWLGDTEEGGPSWLALLIGYMAAHGYWPKVLDTLNDVPAGVHAFVMGMSPRGVCHQVIYRDGVLWHDPHPSRDGVTDVREVLVWERRTFDHTPTAEEPR